MQAAGWKEVKTWHHVQYIICNHAFMNHTAATYLTCHYLCHGLSMQKVYQASFEYIKPMHISHCYMSSAVPWEKTMLKDWFGLWQRIWCGNILQSISSSQAACHTVIPSPSFMPYKSYKYLPCKLYTPYILWCEHEYIRNNISSSSCGSWWLSFRRNQMGENMQELYGLIRFDFQNGK